MHAQQTVVVLSLLFSHFEICHDMPMGKTPSNVNFKSFPWVLLFACMKIIRTCKHSDVLALPQQLSPFSWRSKQSNSVCSSLRRQLDSVSWLLIDVAHVFWQFTFIAWRQHSRPDQCAPRYTAKCVKSSIRMDFYFQTSVNIWIRYRLRLTVQGVVHTLPKVSLNRWTIPSQFR